MIITDTTVLDEVEHVLASGTGTLDFVVAGEKDYYTWHGREDADWTVTGIENVENAEEDRIIVYPTGDFFHCEIESDGEEHNEGPVRCISE